MHKEEITQLMKGIQNNGLECEPDEVVVVMLITVKKRDRIDMATLVRPSLDNFMKEVDEFTDSFQVEAYHLSNKKAQFHDWRKSARDAA